MHLMTVYYWDAAKEGDSNVGRSAWGCRCSQNSIHQPKERAIEMGASGGDPEADRRRERVKKEEYLVMQIPWSDTHSKIQVVSFI